MTDFIGAAFPVVLLWKVDIPLGRKVALCLLMGLGVVYVLKAALCQHGLIYFSTAGITIVRTALSWEITSEDMTCK